MTREEDKRFNELCEIPLKDMTDAEWAEWLILSQKVEEAYNRIDFKSLFQSMPFVSNTTM